MTKEEQYLNVLRFKAALELKINRDYLPLQKQMDKLLDEQNLKEYLELEAVFAALRTQIADEYDELLRMRNELDKRFASSR
jgi:hypothetical protein